MSFRFTTTQRERGDYTEPSGPEETLYMGSDANEALAWAMDAVGKGGKIVNIRVESAPRRRPPTPEER